MSSARDWVDKLGLTPHPEGGYFRRIYESPGTVQMERGLRFSATSIYYLLDSAQPLGRLHRNRSDILHFLLDGGPIEYVLLGNDGELRRQTLSVENRYLRVPGGEWKGSRLIDGAMHGLISEVVVPGFDDADHEFAVESEMRVRYSSHWPALEAFIRPRSELRA